MATTFSTYTSTDAETIFGQFNKDNEQRYKTKKGVDVLSFLNDTAGLFKVATLDVTSAQILALNTTPLTVLAAPGAGSAYIPWFVGAVVDFNAAAYATNTDIVFEYATSGTDIGTLTGILAATADAFSVEPSAAIAAHAMNQAIQIREGGGDPVTGDSPVTVFIIYSEVTIA